MNDEIKETSEAAKEIAKAAGKGLDLLNKFGSFIGDATGDPIKTLSGILNDQLLLWRHQRGVRFYLRFEEEREKLGLGEGFRFVPPKLAVPIIENAILEDNDDLQDIWINLFTSAIDPEFDGKLRSAFIDIIKQLEVVDIHILNGIYWRSYRCREKTRPQYCPIFPDRLGLPFRVSTEALFSSIDNLIRVRCIDFYLEDQTIESDDESINSVVTVPVRSDYKMVCMTFLGVEFVEACTRPKTKNESGE